MQILKKLQNLLRRQEKDTKYQIVEKIVKSPVFIITCCTSSCFVLAVILVFGFLTISYTLSLEAFKIAELPSDFPAVIQIHKRDNVKIKEQTAVNKFVDDYKNAFLTKLKMPKIPAYHLAYYDIEPDKNSKTLILEWENQEIGKNDVMSFYGKTLQLSGFINDYHQQEKYGLDEAFAQNNSIKIHILIHDTRPDEKVDLIRLIVQYPNQQ
ncbi:MAG: hypothetical protein ACOYUZ_06425 [Patescibacteria group bacterium]